MSYPPFQELVRILCTGPKAAVEEHIRTIGEFLRRSGAAKEELFGPAQAPLGRIKGRHRWQIVLKGSHHHLLEKLPPPPSDVHVAIDVDPLFLL